MIDCELEQLRVFLNANTAVGWNAPVLDIDLRNGLGEIIYSMLVGTALRSYSRLDIVDAVQKLFRIRKNIKDTGRNVAAIAVCFFVFVFVSACFGVFRCSTFLTKQKRTFWAWC